MRPMGFAMSSGRFLKMLPQNPKPRQTPMYATVQNASATVVRW